MYKARHPQERPLLYKDHVIIKEHGTVLYMCIRIYMHVNMLLTCMHTPTLAHITSTATPLLYTTPSPNLIGGFPLSAAPTIMVYEVMSVSLSSTLSTVN